MRMMIDVAMQNRLVAVVKAGDAALFLDLDGTLAEFKPHPRDVGPDARRSALLKRLSKELNGRVAVVSGRTISDVDRITEQSLSLVAGVHGLERRNAAGVVIAASPHPALKGAIDQFEALMQSHPGVLLEIKPLGAAIHYREAPDAGVAARQVAMVYAEATGLAIQSGDMVIELLTPGRTKGDAVAEFMAEPPFAGATPIFIGDDLTDEAGFEAVADYGGVGVIVGSRRNTAAQARLLDVEHVLSWLAVSLEQGEFRLEKTP